MASTTSAKRPARTKTPASQPSKPAAAEPKLRTPAKQPARRAAAKSGDPRLKAPARKAPTKTTTTRRKRAATPPAPKLRDSLGGKACDWIETFCIHGEGDLFGQPAPVHKRQNARARQRPGAQAANRASTRAAVWPSCC